MDWWGTRALTRALLPATRPLGGFLASTYTLLRQHQSDSFTTSGTCATAGANASGQAGQAQRASSSTCSSLDPATMRLKLYTHRHSAAACVNARATWLHLCFPVPKLLVTSSNRSISTAGRHTYSTHTSATSATISTPTTSSTALPVSAAPRRTIAVALSGGVDSAVAAWLLQQQGHRLVGVFMRNWDEREETGNDNCSVEADLRGAQAVARHLGIELLEADFVQEYWNKVGSSRWHGDETKLLAHRCCGFKYGWSRVGVMVPGHTAAGMLLLWLRYCGGGALPVVAPLHVLLRVLLRVSTSLAHVQDAAGHVAYSMPPTAPPLHNTALQVFSHFTSEYARGLTPNPDLACNRYIKFDALVDFAQQQGCEQVATGHYARLVRDPGSGVVQLLRGLDPSKDQSYFLASVRQAMLQRFTFPVGGWLRRPV